MSEKLPLFVCYPSKNIENFRSIKLSKKPNTEENKSLLKIPNAEKLSKKVSKKVSKNVSKKVSKETPNAEKPFKKVSKNVSKKVSKKTPNAEKSSKKVSKKVSKKIYNPHSSHIHYTEADIVAVSKWLKVKHPNNSDESIRNTAISQLKTSHRSINYLKGNATARSDWHKAQLKKQAKAKAEVKAKANIKKPTRVVTEKQNFDNTKPTSESEGLYNKKYHVPLLNVSYHTGDDNKKVCVGGTCFTQDHIKNILSEKLHKLF